MKIWIVFFTLLFVVPLYASSADSPAYQSKYLGEEDRSIKSLSAEDIRQLKNGKGWGLAKAAELNGLPGPAHILQMKDKISLSNNQEKQVQSLFEDMESKAIPLGFQLVDLEKKLNEAFANKTITKELLKEQLDAISAVNSKLRYVHLAAHLMTPDILSPVQIEKYNQLRGYHSGDPCKNIPEGHDADMWRRHNDCE